MDKAKDWKIFFGLIGILDQTYNRESSKERVEIYFQTLKEFEIKDIEKAVYQAVGTQKFYPFPATLIELITGSVDDRAEIAWMHVVEHSNGWQSYLFDDPIIPKVINHLWGNWTDFCGKLLIPDMPFMAKDFKSCYKALARSGFDEKPQALIGVHLNDYHNRPSVYTKPEWIPKIIEVKTGIKSLPKTKQEEIPESIKPLLENIGKERSQ